jgi:hypothetical protein
MYVFYGCMPLALIYATVLILVFSLLTQPVWSEVDFAQCLERIHKTSSNLSIGVTDNQGNLIGSTMNGCNDTAPFCQATAITYSLCLAECGDGQEPFSWNIFSQQFGAWLLPWLALLSQLPFGAKYRADNLMSVILTIGSPTLAAYSLTLTILNSHWLARRFSSIKFPNVSLAYKALSGLQQSPVHVDARRGLLPSLVILPENDLYWEDLVHLLNYTHTWTISAVTNLLWVIIAYIFTVINAFTNIDDEINSNGQATGSLWLWLPTIVVGWLQVSPKCDYKRIVRAIESADGKAHVASKSGPPVSVEELPKCRGLSLLNDDRGALFDDQQCTAPIYNYARVFNWAHAADTVAQVFANASARAQDRKPVGSEAGWIPYNRGLADGNRRGTLEEVERYGGSIRYQLWVTGVWTRIALASASGLALQWTTVGSAILIVWNTPTTGLGCRSGAYILYGVMGSVIWAMLLMSTILTHYATRPRVQILDNLGDVEMTSSSAAMSMAMASGRVNYDHSIQSPAYSICANLSIALRRLAKFFAIINTVWVLTTSIFQFTNFFNRCYCNSSVLGHGSLKAYDVISNTPEDLRNITHAWVGALILAGASAVSFVFGVNLWIDPPLPTDG